MKKSEIAKQVREILRDPDKWLQHDFAKGNDGKNVVSSDDEASRFCLVTAFAHIGRKLGEYKLSMECSKQLATRVKGKGGLVGFNDTHSHKEVISALDKYILSLEKEEVTVEEEEEYE